MIFAGACVTAGAAMIGWGFMSRHGIASMVGIVILWYGLVSWLVPHFWTLS